MVIIVVILTVALIGTLGFVFWQNFMQPKASSPIKADSSKNSNVLTNKPLTAAPSEVALTEIASDKTAGSGLALKYPSTWTMTHENYSSNPDTVATPDTSTITSPDGKITIKLRVAISGLGGTCDKDDTSYQFEQIQIDPMPYYPGHNLFTYVTQYSSGSAAGDYYYYVDVLEATAKVLSLKVGDSPCYLGLGIFPANGDYTKETQLTLTFNDFDNYKPTTLSNFNKAIATDNFKVAKRIMQSLYVK